MTATESPRRSWLDVAAERLTQVLLADSAASYRAFGAALLLIFAVVGVMLVSLGPAPISGPWDVVALLDAAWRMVCGQVPHTDYHNPIGVLTYAVVVFGMRIAAPSVVSICYGIALLMLLLLPWAWFLSRRRLPAAVAFAFVLFLGFLLVAPRPLSYPVHDTSYAMLYNRDGYVLLSLLFLCLFVPVREGGRLAANAGGLAIGLLLGLMLYCKITYFIFGVGSVGFALLLDRRRWTMLPAALLGTALVCAAFALLFHIDPRAYLADIYAAGQAQALGMREHLLVRYMLSNSDTSYLTLVCLLILAWADARNEALKPAGLRPLLVLLWMFAVALGIDSGNAAQVGEPEDPLYVIAGLVIVELYRRRAGPQLRAPHSPLRVAYTIALLLIIPLIAGPTLLRDAASFGYASLWHLRERPHYDASRRLHSERLQDFYVPASVTHITSYWPARDHPANINDGIDLLRRHLQPGDRVTTIAYTNPFTFALGLQPALDGPQWWDLNFSFDRKHHPSAESFLGAASLVMVPRFTDRSQGWNFETVDLMLELYSDYLQAHFELLDSSEHWTLYRRRG